MSAAKSGIIFFVVFVSLSATQRVLEGQGWPTNVVRDIVTALIATLIFVVLMKLFDSK